VRLGGGSSCFVRCLSGDLAWQSPFTLAQKDAVRWSGGDAYIATPLGGPPSVEAFFEEIFGRG